MNEMLDHPKGIEIKPLVGNEAAPSRVKEYPEHDDVDPAKQAEQQAITLRSASGEVKKALETNDLEKILDELNFSPDKYNFAISDSYQAEASTGEQNTRTEGQNSLNIRDLSYPQYYGKESVPQNKWGNPRDEAHSSRRPVERVGIRASTSERWVQTEKLVPMPGWRGKLGLEHKRVVPELQQVEPTYTFDYELATPALSDDKAALDLGNRAGQGIRFSLKLSKEQAKALSAAIQKDPTVARAVLDRFVRETGDNGKWNAEIFDEDGQFYDPGERYGDGFVARDVRPRYDAMPDLKPEIIGLVGDVENEASSDKSQFDADNKKAA